MQPGYFIGILIMLFIIGEYFWKHKKSTTKEIIIIVIAAIVAGAFAGFALEWALSLFRTFMQANVGESKSIEDIKTLTAFLERKVISQSSYHIISGWN